jgi:replicative DNA helicase
MPTFEEPTSERTLPHNLEAERSVLGAIIVQNDAFEGAAQLLKPAHFYRQAHGDIFTAIRTLIDERRRGVDFITLKEELTRIGKLDECGGPAYLAGLIDGMPRTTNVRYYAEIVREKALMRDLIYTANKVLSEAYDAEDPPAAILARADKRFVELSAGHLSGRLTELREDVFTVFNDIEQRVAKRGQLLGITTGYPKLNDLTFGWQAGELIVMAARPSMGKSTLSTNCAVHAALAGKSVAMFSLEMRKPQLHHRILAQLSGIHLERLRGGFFGGDDYKKLGDSMESFSKLPLAIDDSGQQTVWSIRGICRRRKAEHGLDLVVIDYVQLMQGSLDRKGANRNEEITDISRRLKVLADDIAAPIILVSQLRRHEGRPKIDDLRESGALEQDADTVLLLYRKNHRAGGLTECILAKQRNGPTGTISLSLDRDVTVFTEAPDAPPADQDTEPEEPRRKRRRTKPPYLRDVGGDS